MGQLLTRTNRRPADPGFDWPIAISPNGKYLVVGGPLGQITIYHPETYVILDEFRIGGWWHIHHLAFSPDGRWLAISSYNNNFAVLDVSRGFSNFYDDDRLHYLHGQVVTCLTFSPDNHFLAVGISDRIALVDLVRLNRVTEVIQIQIQPGYQTENIAFSPDGQHLAIGRLLGEIEIRSIADTELIPEGHHTRTLLEGHYDHQRLVAYSKDGRYVYTTDNGCILSWEIATGRYTRHLYKGNVGNKCFLKISPNGKWLVLAGKYLHIWNTKTWALTSSKNDVGVGGITISPDSQYIYGTYSDDLIFRYRTGEIAAGQLVKSAQKKH